MFFNKTSSKNHKITTTRQIKSVGRRGDRRLTIERLESRPLLSVSPIAAQAFYDMGRGGHGWGGGGGGGSPTADTPTQFEVIAPHAAKSGVQTTVELLALDANGRFVGSYDGSTTGLTLSDSRIPRASHLILRRPGCSTMAWPWSTSDLRIQYHRRSDDRRHQRHPHRKGRDDRRGYPRRGNAVLRLGQTDPVQAGVQTTIELMALDASGNLVKSYRAWPR